MRFHSMRIGKRSLMEVPEANTAIRLAAVACYPGHTLKKRLLRRAIRLGFRSGILPRISPARSFSLPVMSASCFENWMSHVEGGLDESAIYPVMIWPGDPGRGRVYFYFLDREGTALAFGKLALDEVNGQKIRNEASVLGRFGEKEPRSFRVPKLLAEGKWDGLDYLITACVPKSAQAVHLSEETGMESVVRELNSDGCRETNEPPSWWQPVLDACCHQPAFETAVRNAGESGWKLCRVHGDLNRTNLLRDGEELWLIDWEQSCPDGPRLVDEVCLEIDRWWNLSRSHDDDDREACLNRLFAGKEQENRSEMILALAFLHSVHFSPATALVEVWKEESVSAHSSDTPAFPLNQ
ncbi:MAG: hypothetical protein P1U90_10675 [Akkermansiaceae bacterium]|nr:hypothetical protein [Akkermansiaceae bacterium]